MSKPTDAPTPLRRWLLAMDAWLADNHASPQEAYEWAMMDGVPIKSARAMAIAGGRWCERWLHRNGRREPYRSKPTKVSGLTWARLDKAIVKRRDAFGQVDTVAQAKSLLRNASRINQPLSVVDEALRARWMYKPLRQRRPRYLPNGETV